MIKRQLSKEIITQEPWQVWNAFVDLVAMEDYNDLTETQKVASAIFWYNTEVLNGGHMQYLANQGVDHLKETIKALEVIQNMDFLPLLAEAHTIYTNLNLEGIDDVESYVEMALEDHFITCDVQFYEITPTLDDILEEYLSRNEDAFIEFI